MASMESYEAEWKRRAAEVLQEVGILPSATDGLALDLFTRYREPHRVYHDTRHITFIFDFAAEHGVVLTPIQSLAILYHDAIYEVGAKDNEIQSARLLVEEVTGKGGKSRVAESDTLEAAAIVRDTAQHFVPVPSFDSRQSPLVLDLDIANMSLAYDEFLVWNTRVAEEYVGYPLAARIKFLEEFLARPRVTMSEPLSWMEQSIRNNLSRLLRQLSQA